MFSDPLSMLLKNYNTDMQKQASGFNPSTPGNIDLYNRPKVQRGNGQYSTVDSIGVEMDGKHYVLPQITEDGRIMNEEEAIQEYLKNGKHLGVFDSQQEADEYAQKLHEDQEQLYGANNMQEQYHPMIQALMNMFQKGGY